MKLNSILFAFIIFSFACKKEPIAEDESALFLQFNKRLVIDIHSLLDEGFDLTSPISQVQMDNFIKTDKMQDYIAGLKKELKKYQSYTISESALKYKRDIPNSFGTPCTDALDSDYASAAVTVAACLYYGGFAAPEGCLVVGAIMVAKAEYDYHICMQQYNQQ